MQQDTSCSIPKDHLLSDVLIHLNISLATGHNFPQSMTSALQKLGEITGHDRIQIVEIHNNMTYTIRYEWNEQTLPPVPERIKHNTLLYDQLLEKQLCDADQIIIQETDFTENEAIRELLQEQNCRRMLVLPLFESEAQFAFIIFMQCKQTHDWNGDEIRFLNNLASLIAIQLDNHYRLNRLYHQIKRQKKQQESAGIFHSRLQQLHTEMLPAWENVRQSISRLELKEQIPELENLDEHFGQLDKLCRITIAAK